MRYPAVAGRFYPLEGDELSELVHDCFIHECGPGAVPQTGSAHRIRAMVVPHAGIGVSGPVAAHAFAELKKNGHHDAYIIIGPDHCGQPFDLVMSSETFLTPMGECPINMKIAAKLRELIPDSPNAHRREHSIEVEIPFLQYIDPDAEIVPIIMGRQDRFTAEKLASAIRTATAGTDAVVIASSDLMHYVPDPVEKRLDAEFLGKVVSKDIEGIYNCIYGNHMSVCGFGPIAAAAMIAEGSSARLLKHSNSWETIRYDPDAVVGYASAIFEN